MKKKLIPIIFAMLFISSVSAELVVVQQPNDIYNLGERIDIPIKIKSLTETSGIFSVNLICNGIETEFYKEYIFLIPGEEKERTPSIPLIKSFIGRSTGKCRIKSSLKEEIEITKEFKISNLINLNITSEKKEFAPEEEITIEIEAIEETGKFAEGFAEATITSNGEKISVSNTVTNGYSRIDFTMPKETKAGDYSVEIDVYEKDSEGEITNIGEGIYRFIILHIPTSLELVINNSKIEPGTNLLINTILHDQTGESINSNVTLTIKNSDGMIMEKIEKKTEEIFEFPIGSKEPPKKWTVTAESNNFTIESQFEILEKKLLNTEIINDTLKITNIGNVLYNDTLLVKIGQSSVNMNVTLGIDESREYLITAPDGNYKIEIINHEGGSSIIENIPLTGKTVSIKEASDGIGKIIRHPFVWFFIVGIFCFGIFMILRKGYKRTLFGNISMISEKQKDKRVQSKELLFNTRNIAELSLSIQGDKQDASIICLKIKNFRDVKLRKDELKETLQRITSIAEESKAEIYENQESTFFILAPSKTKTFSNEKKAIDTAQKIKDVLDHHNKLYRQIIDYGLSINYGTIIGKQEGDRLKFMSMGTLMTNSKKVALISKGEILLTEKIRGKLDANIKTQKQEENGIVFYIIRDIRNPEEHQKFIKSFLNRNK